MTEDTAKAILDKYAMYVLDTSHTFINSAGETQPNQDKLFRYSPDKYKNTICLWIAPPDCIRVEFEDTPENNDKYIDEIERNVRATGYDYCITGHDGGKSKYLNIFNLKGIPLTSAENKKAKLMFLRELMSPKAMSFLDKTNLGATLSPVINHSHWKKKYDGAIHKIIYGTNPTKHKNKFPKDITKKVKAEMENIRKANKKLGKNIEWLDDFFRNYITTHVLPGGDRHYIIEKNLTAWMQFHDDGETVKQQYLEMNRPNQRDTLETWESAIERGEFTEVSPGEIYNWIQEKKIPYDIKQTNSNSEENQQSLKEPELELTEEHKKILQDPLLVSKLVKEIQNEGVVGNEASITALIFHVNLRNVCDANPVSKNLLVTDKSGGGKDNLVKSTLRVMLHPFYKEHYTTVSPTALNYFHTGVGKDKDNDWTWDRKVFYAEDPHEDFINHPVIKTTVSGAGSALITIDQQAVNLKIRGQPVFIMTSYEATINEEGVRRWSSLGVDPSEKTTKAVAKRLSTARSSKNSHKEKNVLLREAIQALPLKCVIIEFGELLVDILPTTLMSRTKYSTLTDLICSSAVLHQFQRSEDAEGNIIATYEDLAWALTILEELNGYGGYSLSSADKEFLSLLPIVKEDAKTVKELAQDFSRSDKWIYTHKGRLKQMGLVKEVTVQTEYSIKGITKLYTNFQANFSSISQMVSKLFSEEVVEFSLFLCFLRNVSVINKKTCFSPLKNSCFKKYLSQSGEIVEIEKISSLQREKKEENRKLENARKRKKTGGKT